MCKLLPCNDFDLPPFPTPSTPILSYYLQIIIPFVTYICNLVTHFIFNDYHHPLSEGEQVHVSFQLLAYPEYRDITLRPFPLTKLSPSRYRASQRNSPLFYYLMRFSNNFSIIRSKFGPLILNIFLVN